MDEHGPQKGDWVRVLTQPDAYFRVYDRVRDRKTGEKFLLSEMGDRFPIENCIVTVKPHYLAPKHIAEMRMMIRQVSDPLLVENSDGSPAEDCQDEELKHTVASFVRGMLQTQLPTGEMRRKLWDSLDQKERRDLMF